jgi:glycosyltransferase involved in cell wall biosynthesis
MKLIIQIPCYNEETTLPAVIHDLPRRLPGVDEIEYLVIDDGSSDHTVAVARDLGVHHICRLGHNRGLAAAFRAGITLCLELGADVIVNTDGDNQYDADSIADLISPILSGEKDIVIGVRPIREIRHFSALKKALQHLGSYVVRRFSGTDVPDATSGFRAYSAEAALRLHVYNRYTYTLETIIQAGHTGVRIGHVPIKVNPKTRESRLISSIPRYVRRSATIILRSYTIYCPLRTFLSCAILQALLGLLLCLRFLYYRWLGDGVSHLQSLVVAVALLAFSWLMVMLGVVADLIGVNRRLLEEVIFAQRKDHSTNTQRKVTPVETNGRMAPVGTPLLSQPSVAASGEEHAQDEAIARTTAIVSKDLRYRENSHARYDRGIREDGSVHPGTR